MKLTEQDIKWYNEGQDNIKVIILFKDGTMDIVCEGFGDTFVESYAFITNPKYGFLDLFNKPDSPWQEGFEDWMNEMQYGESGLIYNKALGYDEEFQVEPTPQMLTGYILEYLESER